MGLEILLVLEQLVESLVEALVRDAVRVDADEVFQGGSAVPVLGDMQLTGRFAQPRDDENHRHVSPVDPFAAPRQRLLAEPVELQRLPQEPAEPNASEGPPFLQPYLLDANARQLDGGSIFEEVELTGAFAEEMPCELRGLRALLRVKSSKVRHGFLAYLAALANGPNEAPVRVRLAVPLHSRVSQIHARVSSALFIHDDTDRFNRVSWHYIAIRAPRLAPQMMGIGLTSRRVLKSAENSSNFPQTVQVGLGLQAERQAPTSPTDYLGLLAGIDPQE